ncbi:MAG: 3-oxoacyl-ACP synthase III [Deltaproteobacteria bacterium]|nr:3-oxoacyl-ACP synthase III [Deltaproteobacteria bacterium]
MKFDNVGIEAVGYVLPPKVVRSEDLEATFARTLQRLGMPRGQVESLSGVRERRWFDEGTQPSVVAAMAAERALQRAGIDVSEVDLLINTSVSRDYLEPATACLVGGQLGVGPHCFAFDVTNACLGFLNGLLLAANMVEAGQTRVAVVSCAETPRAGIMATLERLASDDATIDTFRDNFASLTLGEGAAAAVVVPMDRSRTGHRLRSAVWRTATQHNHLCLGQLHEMRANAHGLLVHGVDLAVETFPFLVEEMGWQPGDIDQFVCHQVSLAHFSHVFRRLELPMDRALLTFPYLGNVGPTSLPLTLALGEAQGRIVAGQELCCWAVGSGLGCMMMGVSW